MPHLGTSDQIERGATFPEFALRCATMFLHDTTVVKGGVLGVQIPKVKLPSYHRTNLAKAKTGLKMLEGLSARKRLQWAAQEAGKAFQAEQDAHRQYLAQQADAKKKYEAMRAQAKAWEPPTSDHSRLKEIMLEQVDECISDLRPIAAPKRKTAKQFLAAEMARLKHDISYHSEHLEKDRESARSTNQWVGSLTESLVGFRNGKPPA